MPKAYVIGALMPKGGSFMAYHIGRLLHLHFGYELVALNTTPGKQLPPAFAYDVPVRVAEIRETEPLITADDLIIVNPSYSHALFGLRLPGRKIMYVQGFNTFDALDCQCDLYVSVSGVVQRYIQAVYGITSSIIPPFLQLENLPSATPWQQRPANSALVYAKITSQQQEMCFQYLLQDVKKRVPQANLSQVVVDQKLTHAEFLQKLASVRVLVHLTMAEGFGLVPLESMALGTLVTGLDALGGADYLRPGENGFTASPSKLRDLPQQVARAFADEKAALACVEAGKKMAQRYNYEAFKASWLAQLSAFLQTQPVNP